MGVLTLLTIYPVLYSLFNSFYDWNWGSTRDFVGFGNYTRLLSDGTFWYSMYRTVYFSVGAVVVELALGLGLAVILAGLGRRGRAFVRTVLLLPLMISGIVVSLAWKIMLDPTFGVIPHFLQGISPTAAYLGDPVYAMPLIIGIDTWWQTAFVFIILTAALESLPAEPYEAAAVDGANAVERFWYITMPALKPWLLTVAVVRIIDTLKVFDIIFGTTGGGPGKATDAIQILTYRVGFGALQMSDAMTLMILFLLLVMAVLGLGAALLRRLRRGSA